MGITAPINTIVGVSEGIKRVVDQIHQVAPTASTVLVTGETGTERSCAKAIHNLVSREWTFYPINIATFPWILLPASFLSREGGFYGSQRTIQRKI
jgi:Nif-specific regulatory protein